MSSTKKQTENKEEQKHSQEQYTSEYHSECETSVNELANMCITGCYECNAICFHYKQTHVGLLGIADYHDLLAVEQYRAYRKLVEYQVSRNGRVRLMAIPEPCCGDKNFCDTPMNSFECCLAKYKRHYEAYCKLYTLAHSCGDAHLAHFVECDLMGYCNKRICEMVKKMARLRRAGPGLGEYEFDRDLRHYIAKTHARSLVTQDMTGFVYNPPSTDYYSSSSSSSSYFPSYSNQNSQTLMETAMMENIAKAVVQEHQTQHELMSELHHHQQQQQQQQLPSHYALPAPCPPRMMTTTSPKSHRLTCPASACDSIAHKLSALAAELSALCTSTSTLATPTTHTTTTVHHPAENQ